MTELQNTWAKTVQKMFRLFGLTKAVLYDPRVRPYIDELVDKRNAVSHGRESASVVGQAYTTGDLQNLINEIKNQTTYMLTTFETHVETKGYIKPAHRRSRH